PIWDPDDPEADPVTGFTPPRTTQSPADYFVWICMGRSNKGRVDANKRVDLATMKEWREWCAAQTPPLTCNDVIDSQASVKTWLKEVAQAGRAMVTRKNGKYSVTIDRERTAPRQIAVARNIVANTCQGRRKGEEPLHAIRARFRNEQENWQEDQRFVYAPGYGAGDISQVIPCSVSAADQAIVRSTGSFIDDGWVPGAWVTVGGRGISANNGTRQIKDVTATRLYLAVQPGTLQDEGTLFTTLTSKQATNTRE